MSEIVQLILQLRGGRAFQSDMAKSTRGVEKFGDESERSGKQTKKSWKEVGRFAANSAMVYGGARFLKSSADSVTELAKSTMMLQRSTGMEATTASAWVSMLKTRGVETKQFNVGMVKLSKGMVKASTDSEKYAATFGKLGISQETVRAGDINSILLQSADAFSKMTNPAEKAAMAQELFGKQGQTLLPIFNAGSEGIKEQLGLAEKYGATIGGKTAEDTAEFIKKQRELKFAQEGVKVQLGQAMLPLFVQFGQLVTQLTGFLGPLLKNSTALKVVIVGLTTAFVGMKAAAAAATLAQLGLTGSTIKSTAATVANRVATIATSIATKAWAAAQWLLNAALTANPIGLVIVAVVALGAALVLAYKKSETFRRIVNAAFRAVLSVARAAWGWIRANWPKLLGALAGPIGLAVGLIIKHFDKIRGAASAAVHYVADRFRDLIGFLRKVPGAIKDALGGAFDFVTGIGNTVAGGVGNFASGLIPGKAAGGTIPYTGSYMVGERGPEIVRLPKAAEVVPNHAIGGLAGGAQTVVTQVFLDRRQIAEAVGTATSDRLARR